MKLTMDVQEWLDGAETEAIQEWLVHWNDHKATKSDGTDVLLLDAPYPTKRLEATREDLEDALERRQG